MAMTSTQFMAGPGGFGSVLASKLDKVDCSQVLAAVLKSDRQLLGHIKMGATAKNIEFNWIEDMLNAVTFDGCTSASGSVGVIGFTGSASLGNIIRDGALITPRDPASNSVSVDFVLRVTSATGASTLITAAYGSTVWVCASATMTWYVIGQPYQDIIDASEDISLTRTKKRNFTQIFERAIQITQTRKGMDMEAVTDELQYQIKQRTLEIKRELDMAVILGIAYYSGGYSADIEYRTMQGIYNYIRDDDLDGTREDTNVTDLAGAALTISGINALLYKIWDAGGLDEASDPIIVVGADQQRVIAGFESYLRRVEQGERQVGYYRDIFLSDMGKELPIVLDRWVPPKTLIVLDRARVSLRALQGDAWHMEKMAKTGRSEKWQLSGQYGLEIRNPDACHGMLIHCA
jgi:hypothetical protein